MKAYTSPLSCAVGIGFTLSLVLSGCTVGASGRATPVTVGAPYPSAAPAPAAYPAPAPAAYPAPAPAAYPAAAAPPAAAFPRSGGDTLANAEAFVIGGMLEGVVAPKGGQAFYRFEGQAGVNIRFTFYSEEHPSQMGGINVKVNFLDAYGGKLGGLHTATFATSATAEFDKEVKDFRVETTGPVFVQVVCDSCTTASAHYKLLTEVVE